MNWTFWLYAPPAAVWAACLLLYGLRSAWRRSATGRGQFVLYATLTAVLLLASVLRIVHLPYSWAVVLAVVTMGGVLVAGLVQLVLILRAQGRR